MFLRKVLDKEKVSGVLLGLHCGVRAKDFEPHKSVYGVSILLCVLFLYFLPCVIIL